VSLLIISIQGAIPSIKGEESWRELKKNDAPEETDETEGAKNKKIHITPIKGKKNRFDGNGV